MNATNSIIAIKNYMNKINSNVFTAIKNYMNKINSNVFTKDKQWIIPSAGLVNYTYNNHYVIDIHNENNPNEVYYVVIDIDSKIGYVIESSMISELDQSNIDINNSIEEIDLNKYFKFVSEF